MTLVDYLHHENCEALQVQAHIAQWAGSECLPAHPCPDPPCSEVQSTQRWMEIWHHRAEVRLCCIGHKQEWSINSCYSQSSLDASSSCGPPTHFSTVRASPLGGWDTAWMRSFLSLLFPLSHVCTTVESITDRILCPLACEWSALGTAQEPMP